MRQCVARTEKCTYDEILKSMAASAIILYISIIFFSYGYFKQAKIRIVQDNFISQTSKAMMALRLSPISLERMVDIVKLSL